MDVGWRSKPPESEKIQRLIQILKLIDTAVALEIWAFGMVPQAPSPSGWPGESGCACTGSEWPRKGDPGLRAWISHSGDGTSLASVLEGALYLYLSFWRASNYNFSLISLFQGFHCANTLDEINKSSQFLCSQDVKKHQRPMENHLPTSSSWNNNEGKKIKINI